MPPKKTAKKPASKSKFSFLTL